MAVNINKTKLKKCNVNGKKCKRINVNGVKVWVASVTVTNNGPSNRDPLVLWEDYGYNAGTVSAGSVSVKSSHSYYVSGSAQHSYWNSDTAYGSVICKSSLSIAGGSSGRIVKGKSSISFDVSYERQACLGKVICVNMMVVDVTELIEMGLSDSEIKSHMGYFTGSKTIEL